MKKVAFIDVVHPILEKELTKLGFQCLDFTTHSQQSIIEKAKGIVGIVVRSRFPIDSSFLERLSDLEFIARSGAGLENIDISYCKTTGISLFNAPEGNRNAVAEHALGMLLSLFNHINRGNLEVRNGIWDREGNRGVELEGKTVGIIGFGNNGSAFAKKLRGFDVTVLAYDKYKAGFGDDFVTESSMEAIYEHADVLSLHIPQDDSTLYLVDDKFINRFKKPFYLINLARGRIVETVALVNGIERGAVLGACLDVLEYEKGSFESLFTQNKQLPVAFDYIINSDKTVLSPHVGGWTDESYYKLSKVLFEKIRAHYNL